MNRKLAFYSIIILSALLGLQSCTFTVEEEEAHTAMGEIAEMAIFSDAQTLGELSNEIKDCFAPKIKSISAPERSFKLRIAKDEILKGYHKKNYVLCVLINGARWSNIRDQFDANYIKTIENYLKLNKDTSFQVSNAWASPQKVIFVLSNNSQSLGQYLTNKKEGLHATALAAERQSTIKRILRNTQSSDKFFQSLMESRGFAYRKPFNYKVVVRSDTFIGIKREISDKEVGLYSYYENYTSKDQFTKEYIINKRNAIMKRHIHGPDHPEGKPVYLTTESEENIPITSKEVTINGQYAIETRGWFTMKNGFYGGPFVSYTIYSEKLNRIVTVEGQVFAPNRDVAKYLREIELLASTYQEK